MALGGGIGRTLGIPLLLLNLAFAVIILGLSAQSLDKIIVGKLPLAASNGATLFFVILCLLASVTAVASYISGATHLRAWRSDTASSAQASAWIAWFLLILAFVLAWKEIHIGPRPVKVRVTEAFVIILTVTHFLWTLLVGLGYKSGSSTGTTPHHHKHGNPEAASAV